MSSGIEEAYIDNGDISLIIKIFDKPASNNAPLLICEDIVID